MKAIVNIGLKKGVLDDQGKAIYHALHTLGFGNIVKDVRLAKQIIINLDTKDEDEARKELETMSKTLLANTVIEDYDIQILG